MQSNQILFGRNFLILGGRNSLFWYTWMSLLMFLYIYEFNLVAFGLSTYLTSRRVVVFALLIQAILQNRKNYQPKGGAWKSFLNVVWLHAFLLCYSLFLLVLIGRGTGSHISDNILRLFMFGLLPVWCLIQLFDTVDEFMKVLLIVTIVQATLIILCLLNPSFGERLDTTFAVEESSDYIINHRFGYAGGLACITAPGCLRFSMGLVAAFYFTLKRNDITSVFLYIVLSIICSMVARTGMFVGLAGLLLITINKGANNIVKYVISLLLAVVVVVFIANRIDLFELFNFYRMQDLLYGDGGSDFVESYMRGNRTRIPPLTMETIVIGTGITSGVSGNGVPVNVDGGFFRLYAAYGLIVCIVFYTFMFANFLKNVFVTSQRLFKMTLLFFTIVILIGELKEFTLYQQYMVCLFFTFASLITKQQKISTHNVSL